MNAYAAYSEEIPKNATEQSKWILRHANACLIEDKIHRISANGECLAMQTYFPEKMNRQKNSRLLVFIHGDGIPGGSPSDYMKIIATKFADENTVSTVLIRPGYYDSYGNYSTGESNAFKCDGFPCDSYKPHIVDTIAEAVKKIKLFYNSPCTILVGHSGGGIMSGIILGKYPNLVNGAVLASVVYNVQEWSNRHKWGSYSNSLSPDAWVTKIPKNSHVYIISGDADTNTYPEFAKQYDTALKNAGVQTSLISVPGGTHNSVVLDNSVLLENAIHDALKQCPK